MDGTAKIWQENISTGQFDLVSDLHLGQNQIAHEDWVRDVAWCNNIGIMNDLIATCGEDQNVKIWKRQDGKGGKWTVSWETSFTEPVWKCSWSPVGFMLAVSCGDN